MNIMAFSSDCFVVSLLAMTLVIYKMIVTPAQPGVQFKDAWIPACAGMTDWYYRAGLNHILEDISGTRH